MNKFYADIVRAILILACSALLGCAHPASSSKEDQRPTKLNGGLNGDLLYHINCRIKVVHYRQFPNAVQSQIDPKLGERTLHQALIDRGYQPEYMGWKKILSTLEADEYFIFGALRAGKNSQSCEAEVRLEQVTGAASALDVSQSVGHSFDDGNPVTTQRRISVSTEELAEDKNCLSAFRKTVIQLPRCRSYDL